MLATAAAATARARFPAVGAGTLFLIQQISLVLVAVSSGDQRVLLDTTKEALLDWTRYPYGHNSTTPGWLEESFTVFHRGINWRSYVVCDVGYPDVNNWLWTPFIVRGDANRLYVEVRFSVRNCERFPGEAVKCRETFSLLYYEFGDDDPKTPGIGSGGGSAGEEPPPPWQPESYKLIDRIAADEGRFTGGDPDEEKYAFNVETRSVAVTKKGVYFAFMDQGACLSILAVKVYYLACPETVVNFARFPETPAGPELTSVERVTGRCVSNAARARGGGRRDPDRDEDKDGKDEESEELPTYICKGEGVWVLNSGRCSCLGGHEPETALAGAAQQECRACPAGTFKASQGDGRCTPCPEHSWSAEQGMRRCDCDEGFFRVQPRDEAPCSARDVPAADPGDVEIYEDDANERGPLYHHPGNQQQPGSGGGGLPVVKMEGRAAALSWHDPTPLDTDFYEVKYFVRLTPHNTSNAVITKENSVEITNLSPGVEYGFEVRAQKSSGWQEFGPTVFGTVPDLASSSNGGVLLMGGDSGGGGGRLSSSSTSAKLGVILGSLAAGLLVACLGAVALVVFLRNVRRARRGLGQDKKCRTGEPPVYGGGGGGAAIQPTQYASPSLAGYGSDHMVAPTLTDSGSGDFGGGGGGNNGHRQANTAASTMYHQLVGQRAYYVDPMCYENPQMFLNRFAREIDTSCITIEAIIGGGEFGDVCRGRLNLPQVSGGGEVLVAIKTLKPGSCDQARMDFLREASIMGQFEHPNVIFLQGVVTRAQPTMIITEYMENGSLDTFLRANKGKFQMMQKVGMMRGIAFGMQYLAEINFVHRDLAARNVLVNRQLVCKIADFGLTRDVSKSSCKETGGAYTTKGGKIPVRWTAPEAIAFRKFTSSSDVWSFGIVMWEVMSYGERPYWTWSNQDVIKAIEKGYRLPAPSETPEAIHQLMLDSWQKDKGHRPTFSAIVKTLDRLICSPETLTKLAATGGISSYPTSALDNGGLDCFGTRMLLDAEGMPSSPVPLSDHIPTTAAMPPISAATTVDDWLSSIKMNRYRENFERHGMITVAAVLNLSLHQLNDMGVNLIGHQKKIMCSIQTLRSQASAMDTVSNGFIV